MQLLYELDEEKKLFRRTVRDFSEQVIRPQTDHLWETGEFPYDIVRQMGDLGILGSTDPIAIDQASADLVNRSPGIPGSALTSALKPGQDKFRAIYPQVDWSRQLVYGQELGLGSRRYELIEVPSQGS